VNPGLELAGANGRTAKGGVVVRASKGDGGIGSAATRSDDIKSVGGEGTAMRIAGRDDGRRRVRGPERRLEGSAQADSESGTAGNEALGSRKSEEREESERGDLERRSSGGALRSAGPFGGSRMGSSSQRETRASQTSGEGERAAGSWAGAVDCDERVRRRQSQREQERHRFQGTVSTAADARRARWSSDQERGRRGGTETTSAKAGWVCHPRVNLSSEGEA
jgi:hypothetical protein